MYATAKQWSWIPVKDPGATGAEAWPFRPATLRLHLLTSTIITTFVIGYLHQQDRPEFNMASKKDLRRPDLGTYAIDGIPMLMKRANANLAAQSQ